VSSHPDGNSGGHRGAVVDPVLLDLGEPRDVDTGDGPPGAAEAFDSGDDVRSRFVPKGRELDFEGLSSTVQPSFSETTSTVLITW